MPVLEWDKIEDRRYESGVSRGVLFPLGSPGVAWNGLTGVDEMTVGGDIESLVYDGIKYLDVRGSTTFQAKIQAFSAPRQFQDCEGLRSIVPGFILTRQPRVRFGMAYRTEVNDKDYKLHLIYNAMATPASKTYQTIGENVSPNGLEWVIDAVPPPANGYKPTAHFVIDSSKADYRTMAVLEGHIYGVPTNDPHLPDQAFIIEMGRADPEVIDGGSSSWTGPLPVLLDDEHSSDIGAVVVDGRHSSTRPLAEFVYV